MKRRKRKSRAMDPDLKALRAAYRALEATTPRMQRATCEYLWDRFVEQPIRDRLKRITAHLGATA